MQKRVARWLMGGVVLCAVGAGTMRQMARDQLLAKAHKTALSTEQFDYERCTWHGDHEQLVLRPLDNPDYFGVFTQDIETGKVSPLEPFNTTSAALLKALKPPPIVRRSGSLPEWRMIYLMLPSIHTFSPDGKWLLWGGEGVRRTIPLNVGPGDKASQQSLIWKPAVSKYHFGSSIYWLHDSRRWIELNYDAQIYLHGVTIHNLDTPDADISKTFASRGSRWAIGITPDDHLLSYEPSIPPPSPALIYYDTPLDDPQPVSRKIIIPLPAGATIHKVVLSPDGRRLLWSLRTKTHLPGPPWMQKLCAQLGMKSHILRGLWISRRDGSDLHEIGHIIEKVPKLRGTPQQQRFQLMSAEFLSRDLYQIQWTPDSKRVLFPAGKDVYMVDVD